LAFQSVQNGSASLPLRSNAGDPVHTFATFNPPSPPKSPTISPTVACRGNYNLFTTLVLGCTTLDGNLVADSSDAAFGGDAKLPDLFSVTETSWCARYPPPTRF